jgi:serine/threonine protein kinase/formylglycine-generating enzyme required for sulfatase activity
MQSSEQSLQYRITERAAARGLLSTRQVWEAALAFAQNRNAPPEEILPLSKEQIDSLFPESFEITSSQIFIEDEELIEIEEPLDERKTSHKIPLHPKQEVKPIRHKGLEDPFPSLRAEKPNFEKAPEIQSAEWGLSDVKMWSSETPNKGMRPVTPAIEEEETSPRSLGKRVNKESGPRYVLGEELGRGGIGRVVAALDRLSGRTVALKLLQEGRNDAAHTKRFINEAKVTAQLEHPSVIPIYDMGELEGGVPYYAMRVVSRFSLREILRDPKVRAQWPLNKLCGILLQVSRALAYAHSRGVLHRDIKPANILIGEYGEVYIADWGICKLMEESELQSSDGPATVMGIVLGTPGYMSPEQIRGEPLDARSDLFAIGAILYQVLTGQKPFQGKEAEQLLEATVYTIPKRPRQLSSSCPLLLDELCMKLLSKKVSERPETADDVAIELESYLEGSKEKEKRAQEAERSVEHAKNLLRRYHTLGEEALQLENAARRILEPLKTYDPIEKKRPGWELEQRKATTETLRAKVMAEVIERFSQALAHENENREARVGLAELYYEKAREAELSRQEPQRIFYESMVLEHDDGRYAKIFSSDSWLTIHSKPSGAEISLYRYEPRDRRLMPVPDQGIGRTPIKEYKLLPGRYLLVMRLAGYREILYPVLCQRGEHTEISVNFYTEQQLGVHNLLIPQGHFIFGGDPFADDPVVRQEMFLGDYALARFPVTLGEYLQFINDIGRYDQSQAEQRIPRSEGVDGAYVKQDRRGIWVPRYDLLIGGEGKNFCPEEQVYNIPATAINWFDAMAYCRWRSQREGVQYRLPTEAEWEKAARGTDGRYFPWGDGFDPTFCKMRESRPGLNQPEPVGAFILDESPFGVRDMAGSARCWTLDVFGEVNEVDIMAEVEPSPGSARDVTSFRAVRGGTWGTTESRSRCASRHKRFSVMRTPFIGFRLLRVL